MNISIGKVIPLAILIIGLAVIVMNTQTDDQTRMEKKPVSSDATITEASDRQEKQENAALKPDDTTSVDVGTRPLQPLFDVISRKPEQPLPKTLAHLPEQALVPVDLDAGQWKNADPETLAIFQPPGHLRRFIQWDKITEHANGDVSLIGRIYGQGTRYRVIITSGEAGTFGRIPTPAGVFKLEIHDQQTWLMDMDRAGLFNLRQIEPNRQLKLDPARTAL
ncbi:MAG: hypothetical protein HQL54_09680 [Magnetococcales bacterium]|nr:hypothetical protein [Magnetococcales bacterium]